MANCQVIFAKNGKLTATMCRPCENNAKIDPALPFVYDSILVRNAGRAAADAGCRPGAFGKEVEKMSNIYRDVTLAQVTEGDIGRTVRIAGWVENIRDHGGVSFLDIRDAYAVMQVVIREGRLQIGRASCRERV